MKVGDDVASFVLAMIINGEANGTVGGSLRAQFVEFHPKFTPVAISRSPVVGSN